MISHHCFSFLYHKTPPSQASSYDTLGCLIIVLISDYSVFGFQGTDAQEKNGLRWEPAPISFHLFSCIACLHAMSSSRCECSCLFSSHGRFFGCFRIQWRLRDSNSRPPACKAGALPTELSPHKSGSHLLSHIVSNAVPSAA